MIRNNIDNLHNTAYNPNDWTTWNYRTINADSRTMEDYICMLIILTILLKNLWKVADLSQEPHDFRNKHGFNFDTVTGITYLLTTISRVSCTS